MIDLKVNLFFDRQAVTSAVDRGRIRALNRIGGFLRTTARRSMRRRKGTSPPGSPPYAHTGLLRDKVYFSFDPNTQTVVVGPALVRKSREDGEPIQGTTPQVLEEGGRIRVREVRGPRGGWSRKRRRDAAQGKQTRRRAVPVEARPTMGPALDAAKAADKLSEFWKDVVR